MQNSLAIRDGRVPEIRGVPLLGVVPELLRDPLALYERATALGELVALRLPIGRAYFVSTPALIQTVMQKQSAVFVRPPALRRVLSSLGGDNLMTREGDAWRTRRRLLTPSLQRATVSQLAGTVLEAIDCTLDGWSAHAGKPVCLHGLLTQLTREVVARTLFGVSMKTLPAVGDAFAVLTDYIAFRATTPLAAPLWLPTPRHRAVRRAQRTLDRVVDDMLAHRRASSDRASDLLTSLLHARDPQTGAALSDEALRRELQVLLGAGETTTTEALCFCFSLLGRHPDVLAMLVQEVDDVLGTRAITLSDVARLPLLGQVLSETLRLYPPSYVMARAAAEATSLGDLTLRKGTVVLYAPYTLHRDPRLWRAPDEFDPRRFAVGGEAHSVPRYAYLPFGAGPRRCIGENLAELELTFALARILQRYTIAAPAGPAPALSAGFALSLRDALVVRVTARK